MIRKITRKRVLVSLLLAFILAMLCACGGGNSGKEQGGPPAAEKETRAARDKEKSADVEPLGDVNTIPEDGIITKEQFATVAGEDREISFVGETDEGIKYTWVYQAARIQNPEDQNLKITFETEDLDDIRKEANNANDALKMTMQGGGLICPPTLTVVLPRAWQSDTGLLLKEQDSKLAKMSEVTIVSQPAEKKDQGKKSKNTDSESTETTEEKTGIEDLTEPVEGTTTLTMTVLSLEGDSYVVGGITDPDKLAAINQQMQTVASANANQGYTGEAGSGGTDQGGASYSDGSGSGSGGSGNSGSSSGNSKKGKSGKSSSGDVAGSETGDNSSGSGKSSGSGSSGSSGGTCTISINCSTILSNMDNLPAEKEEFVPSDGWILKSTKVSYSAGESVHDVLQRVCKDKGIHMESSFTPAYDSAYVEGINQIYEFDCGELSGWMYSVNGWFPNYGCSKYTVSDGDVIEWVYTCDLGKDVGDNSMY